MFSEMSKSNRLAYHILLNSAIICHVLTQMTPFYILNNMRCDNTSRVLSLASNKRHVLSCIATCRATTDCNSVNFAPNATAGSCEILQTSEQDFNGLTPDSDWIFYSTNQDLLLGRVHNGCMIALAFSCT